MKEELLSLHEAATRKGVPVGDLRKSIDAGDLPFVNQGGAFYIRAEDLDRWEPHMKTSAGADFTDQEAAEYLRTPSTPR